MGAFNGATYGASKSYTDEHGGGGEGFEPTPEQQEAIDSGITSEILSDIETDIDNLKENLANFIGNFNTYEELIDYSGTLTNNDYAVVSADETHSNECWRYVYNKNSNIWLAQYKINETPINTIDQSSNPTDTDSLSDLNGTTNKRWTFAKIWEWIKSKLVGAISTVLTDNLTGGRAVITNSSGKLIVAAGITAQTTQAIYPVKLSATGLVSEVGTGQQVSDTYDSSANNQIMSRKGGYNMWNTITAGRNTNGYVNLTTSISYMCKNKIVTVRFLGTITSSSTTTQRALATLPTNYRPTGEVQGILRTDYGGGNIFMPFVGTDGIIYAFSDSATFYNARGFIVFSIN